MAEPDSPDISPQQVRASEADAPISAAFAQGKVDLEAIRTNVNDAAAISGGLWLSYLFVLFYLMVGAGAVTHLDLFLEKPVKLPFLSIDLPLLAFFGLAPALFLIVHAYTLIHFVILAEKAKGFHQALSVSDRASGADAPGQNRWRERPDNLRRLLPNNIFVQFLAGPPETRAGLFGLTLRAIAWISLALAPVLLLLLIQVQFLPYQSLAITWLHRVAILIDLALLWWLWRKILSGRHIGSNRRFAPSRFRARAARASAVVMGVVVVLASVLIVTFQGETQQRFTDRLKIFANPGDPARPLSIHEFIFQSTINSISRKRSLPFSNTLVLTNVNLPDALGVEDAEKLKARDVLFRARGRHFRGAIFDHAIMPKVDFFGADLQGASFVESVLDESSFDQADISDGQMLRVVARATSFDHADLSRAVLSGSNFAGADFSAATLNRAAVNGADLSGTKFNDASLYGADIGGSVLFAASLNCADLSQAKLNRAKIDGAFLISARLENANVSEAQIAASDFSNVSLARLVGKPATLARSYLDKPGEVPANDDRFSDELVAAFKQNICYMRSGAGYVLKSEVFKNLSGSQLPALVNYILSPECAISASLTSGERQALLATRPSASLGAYREQFRQCPKPGATPGVSAAPARD